MGQSAGEVDRTLPGSGAAPSPLETAARYVGARAGEYQILELIGQGGMGSVYLGVQPVIGKKVAIKVLKHTLSADPELMERFLSEARAVNTIGHPNIIDIFAFGHLDDGSQYFVMELLSGMNLGAYLAGRPERSYSDILPIVAQILDALGAAHRQGIVHRDLKPDNVFLVDRRGAGFLVKLLDFGLAKFTDQSVGQTKSGVALGTPLYMSPEQCRGRDVDHRSDIYSLGVMLYEIFTGRVPFVAETAFETMNAHLSTPPVPPASIVPLPEELSKIILECLAKAKHERIAGVDALRERLLPLLERLVAEDTPLSHATPLPPNCAAPARATPWTAPRVGGPRRPPKVALGFGALALVAAASLGSWRLWAGSSPEIEPSPPPALAAALPPESPPPPRSDLQPAPEMVMLQFVVTPSSAHPMISVDGRTLEKPELQVASSRTKRISVKVTAPGYQTYSADPLPVSNMVIPVTLLKAERRPSSVGTGPGIQPPRVNRIEDL